MNETSMPVRGRREQQRPVFPHYAGLTVSLFRTWNNKTNSDHLPIRSLREWLVNFKSIKARSQRLFLPARTKSELLKIEKFPLFASPSHASQWSQQKHHQHVPARRFVVPSPEKSMNPNGNASRLVLNETMMNKKSPKTRSADGHFTVLSVPSDRLFDIALWCSWASSRLILFLLIWFTSSALRLFWANRIGLEICFVSVWGRS